MHRWLPTLARLEPFRRRGAPWKRLANDRSGVAALEFTALLPFLLLAYLGTFEASRALQAYRKVGSTAETVCDLVTRMSTINATQINNIFNISGAMLAPFSSAGTKIMVTAVKVDAAGKGTVQWSRASSGTALAAGAVYTAPTDLAALKSTYFVATTVTFNYAPAVNYGGLFANKTITKTYTFRPRKSLEVTWTT